MMPLDMPDQSGSDSVLLDFLRRKRLDETRRNLAMRGRDFATAATPYDAASLEADINDASDTGLEAQKAVSDREKQLATEASFMSPGATNVRKQGAEEKLAALLGAKKIDTDAAIQIEHEKNAGALKLQAGAQDFTREFTGGGGATGAPGSFKAGVNPAGGVSLSQVPPHKPTTEEQRALDTMGSLSSLGPAMLRGYEEQYPGIEKDPSKYAGLLDMLGGRASATAYKTGFMNDVKSDQITQLTGYLEAVLPRMLSSGRINREQYADLKLHVPQVGLPAGSNYARAKYVLDRILPAVQGSIGTQPQDQHDPYNDPNWGAR